MDREQYINCDDVASFTDWFARKIGDQSISHGYDNRRTRRHVVLWGLCGALAQYYWNQNSYDENAVTLSALRSGLGDAIKIENRTERDKAVHARCLEVMKWGGVVSGNGKWLLRNEDGLSDTIANVCRILRSGDDDLSVFPRGMRFNAGMTKIYSLLVSDFIIYDSRVAAALGWFVVQWSRELAITVLGEPLLFPWMPAKEAPNAPRPKKRDPSSDSYTFPRVNGSAAYARWNLRAGWILSEALRKSKEACFHRKNDPLRALEAALFMWGYDLNVNEHPAVPAAGSREYGDPL